MSFEPIVDAHHHIWRLDAVPWLAGPPQPRIFGEYAALRRDYLIDEYLAEALPQGVTQSVYVQINVAPGEEEAEIAWVQSVADAHGFPQAIVGYADLASSGLRSTLDREEMHPNLRAIRQQLHWHANPMYRFAARPDLMNDPAWRAGLSVLEDRGLVFELQVFPSQMEDAARLAREFRNVSFVLLHAGMLEDRSPAGWTLWREGMTKLAACSNVATKLSGLGTFVRVCSVELWEPVIRESLDMFGAERCMFGSNYPIEKLWTSYERIVAVMQACCTPLSSAERSLVFGGTARRIYHLK
jgi:predicted TIM-barrel fold metal-dependent hydrolase